LLENATGSTATGIQRRKFERLEVLLPPPSEQRAIAAALSDVDALISALDKLISKKRAVKTAAMQQLLTGKQRLPGFEKEKGYKQTELGMIPKDWTVTPLGSILSRGRLGGNYSNQDRETSYPLMKMGNIGRGSIDLGKVEYVAAGVHPNNEDKLYFGDLLFNTRNTLELVGKVAIWRDELPLAYYNSNLMRLEFNPEKIASNFFANYMFNSSGIISRLSAIATGTTSVAAIYTRDLLRIPFLVPPREEQTAIANVLSDMDAEIVALEARREKTRQIKQAVMQELLTGRTRLV
jgi:type I restriction enzyme S subunit